MLVSLQSFLHADDYIEYLTLPSLQILLNHGCIQVGENYLHAS